MEAEGRKTNYRKTFTPPVLCASFYGSRYRAIPSYQAIGYCEKPASNKSAVGGLPNEKLKRNSDDIPKHLLLTRSSCGMQDLDIETEMLGCAKEFFKRDLSNELERPVKDDHILTGIHLPILGIRSSATTSVEQFVYISRVEEPKTIREERLALIRETSTIDIATRIDRIVKSGNIAFLTEFIATSEIVRFLRDKTRLRIAQKPKLRDIAFVIRADQFVEFLMNIANRFKDRSPLEIIGSIIRRQAKFYIYPCTYRLIYEGKTRYNTAFCDAFKPFALSAHKDDINHLVTYVQLKSDMEEKYSSLIAYMETEKCLQDLTPFTMKFVDRSNPWQIGV